MEYMVVQLNRMSRGRSWDVKVFDSVGLMKWLEETAAFYAEQNKPLNFLNEANLASLDSYSGESYLVVKIKVLEPRPVQVVTKFEI